MVDLFLAVGLFLLTVAVVGLFAMMGELAARVPDENVVVAPRPIEEITLGVTPESWLDGAAHLEGAPVGVLVVLSTSCASCQRIANGSTGDLALPPESFVLIASGTQERAESFLAEHPMLRQHRHGIDVEGTWLTRNFGINISPSVLIFERGRLSSAHTFTSATTLPELFAGHHAPIKEESHA
ncbi:hypothetical protein ABZ570_26745 [Micromonospora sp. NPDC007271]|uniref:hypothetical protein n=1 Tax=Micromonospora sp. NPDC007271 TaxID=3154587 RepID=UPI0033E5F49B